jgi:ketosteroid isomerase-like protein
MRYLTLGAIACLSVAMGSAAQAQTADPQMVGTITKFMEAFNKGDMAGAAATHAADVVIIDEVAPYLWRGAKAFQAWAGDLDADAKKKAITEPKVTLGTVTRVESDGSSAYVVVPSVYTFKEKGVAMREAAQMTFSLKKGAGGWLIDGWTWTGPKPQKAPAPAKK